MKRSRIQEKKTSPQYSNGIHIPLDLTVNILSKLSVKSLVRFQCVSNLWSSLILDTMIITPTRSNPRRLPLFIFPHWLLNSSTCSSTNYTRITNHATFISATKERFALANGVISSDDFEYEYTRGLLCSGEFGDVPEIMKHINNKSSLLCGDGFFGYDPVEKQSFKLMGGPTLKQQHWRNLDSYIQGHSQTTSKSKSSSGLCINGVIYYIDLELNEIAWLDLKSQRLGRIRMPMIISSSSKFDEFTLINYQGKLGCVHYNCEKNNIDHIVVAKMWVMDHHIETRQECNWSEAIMTPLDLYGWERTSYCIAGATPNGDIVLMPKKMESCLRHFSCMILSSNGIPSFMHLN
ncbi:unnamed protein product [Cochlearia groenlandica]